MKLRRRLRLPLFFLLATASYCIAGCVAALGPGYTILKQQITVQFVSSPQPLIRIEGVYQLKNTGNQPLTLVELRLPGRRRFHFSDSAARWDKTDLSFAPSPDNPRDVLLHLPQPWTVSSRHTLVLSVEYERPVSDENALSFAPDAFFLPAQGWSPELLPARGILATGGVPPASWILVLRVPGDFLVHASGHQKKHSSQKSGKAAERTMQITQTPKDGYPFVVAGRYVAANLSAGDQIVNLWTRAPQNPEALRQPSEALVRAIQAYNSTFGTRPDNPRQLWIIECPEVTGCFTSATSNFSRLTSGENGITSAEMASQDSAMIDLSRGAPQIAAAAPSLASSWLGYGQSPGFFEQSPPLSALPAFAAARGREAVEGPQVRTQIIARLLLAVPAHPAPRQLDTGDALRAKSLLFFYALQDSYGPQVFSAALSHMLSARRGGGFDLDDLIAAFEQETHQNVAQFLRLWMKHPGVPEDFRARYDSAAAHLTLKETLP